MRPPISTFVENPTFDLITRANEIERSRNLDDYRDFLSAVWPDIEADPLLDDLLIFERAFYQRLCGDFLTHFGNATCKVGYQLRAKDLLTAAAENFRQMGERDFAAQAKLSLAHCYIATGEVEELALVLDVIENDYRSTPQHPIYLRTRINQMIALYRSGDFEAATSIVNELHVSMRSCTDERLLAMYHSQAGILFDVLKQPDQAENHLRESIHFSRRLKDTRMTASDLNNLAMLFLSTRQFELAHNTLDQAIGLYETIRTYGLVPHLLDTRSLIFLEQGKNAEALENIDEAISEFSKGEDYAGLVAAMWTKCRCLFALNRNEEGFRTYGELYHLASLRISQKVADHYAAQLPSYVYYVNGLDFEDEVREFKKSLIVRALDISKNSIVGAAKLLKFKSHQHLSYLLDDAFPDIRAERNLPKRKRRSDAKENKTIAQPAPIDREIELPDVGEIAIKQGSHFTVDGCDPKTPIRLFYVSQKMMERFSITKDCVAAVVRPRSAKHPKTGDVIIHRYNGTYRIDQVSLEDFCRMRCIVMDHLYEPLLLTDVEVIGTIVGIADFMDVEKDFIEFSPFDIGIKNEPDTV